MQSALTILFQKNYTLPCMGTAVMLHKHQTLQAFRVLKYLGKEKEWTACIFLFSLSFLGELFPFEIVGGFFFCTIMMKFGYIMCEESMRMCNQIIWDTWDYKCMKSNKLDCYQMILTGSLVLLVKQSGKIFMFLGHKEKWERSWICLLQKPWN